MRFALFGCMYNHQHYTSYFSVFMGIVCEVEGIMELISKVPNTRPPPFFSANVSENVFYFLSPINSSKLV